MTSQNAPDLMSAIKTAIPDKRLIKLTDEQITSLKKASDLALAVIGAAGVVAIAIVAPNVFQAIPRLSGKHFSTRRSSYKSKIKKVGETFYYLKRSGLVRFHFSGKEWLMSLTASGRKRFARLELDTVGIPKPKRWDGRWWLVAADIPTRDYRQSADLLRKKLKQLKFYPLQRTLWVHVYDPRKAVGILCQNYGIAQFVTIMEILRLDVEDEKLLKNHFREAGVI